MRASVALPTAALGVAAALAVATGCGVQSNDTGPNRTAAITQPTTTPTVATVPLPRRPNGTIAVDIQSGDSITGKAIDQFASSSSVSVVRAAGTATSNFAALCAGRADAITSTRAPLPAELAACAARGLTLAAPIQTASDGIVIATQNGSDMGGDCIDVRQARDIFRAGSPYTNWNQLGFDDLPLRTVGRQQGSASFLMFGQLVLGLQSPTIGDVRADYVARTSDLTQRETVTGALAQRRVDAYTKKLKADTRGDRIVYVNAAVVKANAAATKEIEQANARNARKGVTVDAAKLSAANAAMVATVKRRAAAGAGQRFDARIQRQIDAYEQRVFGGGKQRGWVGPFPFSYFGIYEDQLRPFEIDYGVPETQSGQPVQFQDLSNADQVALAKAIGRATGQTKPNPAVATSGDGTKTTNANTTEANSGPQPAYLIDPTTVVPAIDGLPKTTRTGEKIFRGPNCVYPSALSITNGSYPLARRVYVYTTTQALDRTEVRAFLTSYVRNAQALARANDLIPITRIQVERSLATIAGKPQPKAGIIGGREAPLTTPTTTTPATGDATTVPGAGAATTPAAPTGTTEAPAAGGSGIPGVSSANP